MMNKKIPAIFLFLGLLAPSGASAAAQTVKFPSTPISLPGRIIGARVTLPSLPVAPARLPGVVLPGVRIPTVPTLPHVIPGTTGISLPSPAGARPVLLFVASQSGDTGAADQSEKLDKIYDRGERRQPEPVRGSQRPVTVPTNDLLDEIGVSSTY